MMSCKWAGIQLCHAQANTVALLGRISDCCMLLHDALQLSCTKVVSTITTTGSLNVLDRSVERWTEYAA